MNLRNSNDCEIKTIKRKLTNVIVTITLSVTVRALVGVILSVTVTLMNMIMVTVTLTLSVTVMLIFKTYPVTVAHHCLTYSENEYMKCLVAFNRKITVDDLNPKE
jgi:hypothetical protein